MRAGLKGSGKDTNVKDLALALKVREALKTSLGQVFVQLQVPEAVSLAICISGLSWVGSQVCIVLHKPEMRMSASER